MDPWTIAIGLLTLAVTAAGVYYQRRSGKQLKLGDLVNNTSGELDSHDSVLHSILGKRIIRAGCVHYPPLMDFNDKGKATDLYADMLSLIASNHRLEIVYIPTNWCDLEHNLKSDKVDFILSVFATDFRQKFADFAAIMHRIDVGGVVLKEKTDIVEHEDLQQSSIEIAVTRGEIGWEYAEKYLDLKNSKERFSVVEGFDIKKMMGLVKSGDVDIALADALSCYNYCDSDSDSSIINIFSTNPLYVCVNGLMYRCGDDDLGNWLNKNFSEVRRNPRIKRKEKAILQSYYHVIKRVEIPDL